MSGISGSGLSNPYPFTQNIEVEAYTTIIQGTWGIEDLNYFKTGFGNTATKASGDRVDYYFSVGKSGSFTFGGAFWTDPAAGILKLLVDDVQVAAIDLYTGSGAWALKRVTGIALVAGQHKLSLYTNTKHASSSAYYIALQRMGFTPEGIL